MTADRRFGPLITPTGVMFRLWAPAAKRVAVVIDRPQEMIARPHGWFELEVAGAGAGTRYRFRIDDDIEVPDPASAFQPQDVHGPSEVVDHAYAWTSRNWSGRPWHECVLLELHVGAFTPEGSYRGAIDKLDHLVDAGFTAIELMPLSDFAGRWNWGYDGVLPFAPDSSYGRPDDLKALVDAAHQRGLMVFLDVVYNHFGPEGNYLGRYAPGFFTAANTPWGSAIDYRVPQVRAFAIENALAWLRDYRFDGLRLDAVHAIVEPGVPSVLADLSLAVGSFAQASGRQIHLVLENDDNQASLLDPLATSAPGKYRAQWNDDYHHAWHVLLTAEAAGYYRDYRQAPRHLARTLAEGFAYQGEPSEHRQGAVRGEPSGGLPATAFVNFLQNHDQIGNRARGERLTVLAQPAALAAALAVTLLAPMPPLMFMGEEWGSLRPFPFFCDFGGDLAQAVRNGRKAEFADAFGDAQDIPDALSRDTFRSAVLDWDARARPPHRERLDLVRRLLAARATAIVPLLPQLQARKGKACYARGILTAAWPLRDGRTLTLLANLADLTAARPRDHKNGTPVWGGLPPQDLPPWSVYWAIGAA
ncbi:MAG: maltooligosyltrehalose trehalohydrolase [Alphaproteobacteria bacterium]|nr:maltooligosyltrehalose trehalohydrolase [Alphaproteobacteria bacterium]